MVKKWPGVIVARVGDGDGPPTCDPDDVRATVLMAAAPDLQDVARATLMFHRSGQWTVEDREAWTKLTGQAECTTRVLCDFVRAALAKSEAP